VPPKKRRKDVRLLVVDDHRLVRGGFCSLLSAIPFVEAVQEASDGREAIAQIQRFSPDIVFMDIAMPNLNGLDALARIKKDFPEIKVVIVSMHADEEYIVQALRSGASGYVLKEAPVAELELALKSVARGEIFLGPSISRTVISNYLKGAAATQSSFQQLTDRQREILQGIAEGKTTKAIAYDLNISAKTVETHRSNLMERLQIYDIAGLVRYAIRSGLISSSR
jgi:DNA-binding NarL/FixJ family response regulator